MNVHLYMDLDGWVTRDDEEQQGKKKLLDWFDCWL